MAITGCFHHRPKHDGKERKECWNRVDIETSHSGVRGKVGGGGRGEGGTNWAERWGWRSAAVYIGMRAEG